MLDPKTLNPGNEQYEYFTMIKKRRCQYDYRHNDGTLFSCIRLTLKDCRNARDAWLSAKEAV